eukprot:Nk52_evm8s208 gene=Nk52_evmTU8s208
MRTRSNAIFNMNLPLLKSSPTSTGGAVSSLILPSMPIVAVLTGLIFILVPVLSQGYPLTSLKDNSFDNFSVQRSYQVQYNVYNIGQGLITTTVWAAPDCKEGTPTLPNNDKNLMFYVNVCYPIIDQQTKAPVLSGGGYMFYTDADISKGNVPKTVQYREYKIAVQINTTQINTTKNYYLFKCIDPTGTSIGLIVDETGSSNCHNLA